MSENTFSSKLAAAQSAPVQQEPTTQISTEASSSTTASAAATLELLKNPLEGVARGESTGVSYSGAELPGYYSVHCSHIKRSGGAKPLMGSRLGGRFYYPLDGLSKEDEAKLKSLVKKELALYVPNDPTE